MPENKTKFLTSLKENNKQCKNIGKKVENLNYKIDFIGKLIGATKSSQYYYYRIPPCKKKEEIKLNRVVFFVKK